MTHPCGVDGCDKAAARGYGLCWGHYRRKRKGLPLEVPLRVWGSRKHTLMEAAFAFADAADGDEEAYYLAWKRLYAAAKRIRTEQSAQRG